MGRIITFGEIMLRLEPNGFQRFFQSEQLQATFGGAEANVAVSLANFGEDTAFVTKVPSHAIGQGCINSLRSFGVDTSLIKRGGERMGIYYLEKGANQRPSICIYDRAGSSISQADKSEFIWEEIFKGADWFHFTGITPALGPNLTEICKLACKTAKNMNITVSCDLNYRSKLWSAEQAKSAMTELCPYVDVCIANEEDAKNIFGIEAKNTDIGTGIISNSGYVEVAAKLQELFDFSYVAFTLRRSYSATVNDWSGLLFNGMDVCSSKVYHIDNIVDRVGGGDSFGAGLIYALRHGFDMQTTVDFAVASSVLKHSIEGDFNRVGLDDVQRLLGGDESGRVQR